MDLTKPLDLLNNKASVSANTLIEAIINGEVDVQVAAVYLKKIEKIAKEVLDTPTVKEVINRAFIGAKQQALYGATVNYGTTYTAYDYDSCNHPLYNEWKRVAIEAAANMKKIEEQLRNMEGEAEVIVHQLPRVIMESSGEVATVYAPVKTTREGPKFSV